jgi:hypothetical protein
VAARSEGHVRSGIPWPRLALVLLLAWWTLRLASTSKWIFLDFVNLAFHEAGHLFLSFAGSTVHYLGGTLGQLLVPSLLLYYVLARQRQPLGSAFCAWWFGQNLINVSVYMADARELALPLVGGGDHDWNELFFRWGLLGQDSVKRVSEMTHLLGVLVMLVGLIWCAYFALPAQKRRAVYDATTSRYPWLESLLAA